MSRLPITFLGARPPARQAIEEERAAPANAHFAAFLSGIRSKDSPTRFEDPERERPRRGDDQPFTERELDAFLRSLDARLFPSGLDGDAGMKRLWARFWEARQRCFGCFLRRFAGETEAKQGRKLDAERDHAELASLERSLVRVMMREHARTLRAFVGRRGVDGIDLAIALWVGHVDRWFVLATAPSATIAARALLGSGSDGLERSRPNEYSGGEWHAPVAPAKGAGTLRLYQALAATKID